MMVTSPVKSTGCLRGRAVTELGSPRRTERQMFGHETCREEEGEEKGRQMERKHSDRDK